MTEKLWDAMAAGCLPIYFGAPNIVEHLPAPESVINYEELGGTPAALSLEIKRLLSDEAAYDYKMAWRTRPLDQLGEGFQWLVVRLKRLLLTNTKCFFPHYHQAATGLEHSQCRLCKLVAILRAQRRANGTWPLRKQ